MPFSLVSKNELSLLNNCIKAGDIDDWNKNVELNQMGIFGIGSVRVYPDGTVYLDNNVSDTYYNQWRKSPGKLMSKHLFRKSNFDEYSILTYNKGCNKVLLHLTDTEVEREDKHAYGELVVDGKEYDVLKIITDDGSWSVTVKGEVDDVVVVETVDLSNLYNPVNPDVKKGKTEKQSSAQVALF